MVVFEQLRESGVPERTWKTSSKSFSSSVGWEAREGEDQKQAPRLVTARVS